MISPFRCHEKLLLLFYLVNISWHLGNVTIIVYISRFMCIEGLLFYFVDFSRFGRILFY